MDVNRAKEIISSTDTIQVQLNGKDVWLDSVDATSQMVTVHEQGPGQQESITVRVQELDEVGRMSTRM
ncbi:H-type small acid-soluble spore protein [Paenibacillus thermotolerans]|uniref:H-type small acid-soluble spore protein n=1 Tax=Paenibacillus thermotolerans TaxID=3027807 RepID=UPI002367803B|nr:MULTISPECIES: H-type small acid-soluble spore protein [unclassified Paenibacillus]